MYTPIHEKLKVKLWLLRVRKQWTKYFYEKYITATNIEYREAYEERLHHHTRKRIEQEKEVEQLKRTIDRIMEVYQEKP